MQEILKNIIKCLDDAKVNDIKIYETKDITPFYDYVINSTVNNTRQMSAVVKRLEEMSTDNSYPVKGVEGLRGGFWTLVDLRDVLVNIFLTEERKKYDLDKLWQDLPQVSPKDFL